MDYVVGEAKIRRYLLTSPTKRAFFDVLGYTVDDWGQLRDDLRDIATRLPATERRTTLYGIEYEIVGEVVTPNGRLARIRTGWMIRLNEPNTMYFVTAYPA